MKPYKRTPPRKITWHDVQTAAGFSDTTRSEMMRHFGMLAIGKRLVCWEMFAGAMQSVPESAVDEHERKIIQRQIRENRPRFNDNVFFACVRAVLLGELSREQQHKAQDYNDAAEAARRAKWRMSKKQKILRAFDEIEILWNKYGSWSSVLQTMKRKPPKGDYDPFRELRGEHLTAHYLASIMSEERRARKASSQSKREQKEESPATDTPSKT